MAGCKTVMDVLNLWNDDPEELLLELGFGCDEPELSGRIPARFISYPSQARGINLQVFLDAQKTRLDLENPDVSNRFREVEVLQQVTTTLCSLVVSSSSSSFRPPLERHRSPEARERRRRIGSLYRRASKKSFIQTQKSQDLTTSTFTCSQNTGSESLPPSPTVGDNKIILNSRCQEGLTHPVEEQDLEPHTVSSVVAKEQQAGPDSHSQSPSFVDQEDVPQRLQPGPQEDVSPPTEVHRAGLAPQLQSNMDSSIAAEEQGDGLNLKLQPQVVSSTVAEELNSSQEEILFPSQKDFNRSFKPGSQANVRPTAVEQGAGLDPQPKPQVVVSIVTEELRNTSQEEVLPDLSGETTGNQREEMPSSSSSSHQISTSLLSPHHMSASLIGDSKDFRPARQENISPLTEEQGAGLEPQLQPSGVVSDQEREASPGYSTKGLPLAATGMENYSEGVNGSPEMEMVLPDLSRGATGHKKNEMPVSSSSSPPHCLSPPQISSCLMDGTVVDPPSDELGAGLDLQILPHLVSSRGQEREVHPGHLTEDLPQAANTIFQSTESLKDVNEYLDMEQVLADESRGTTDNQEKEIPDQRFNHFHVPSPCPSPKPLELLCSDVSTPQDQSQLDSSSKLWPVAPCSYSQELQHLLNSQRLTQNSAASSTPLIPSALCVQTASLLVKSQEINTKDKDDTLTHDSLDISWIPFSSIPPSPSPDLHGPSSVQFQSPGDAQPQWNEMALHENFLFESSMMSSLHYHSQTPGNKSIDSDGTCILYEQDQTPVSGSFQLDRPLTPSSLPLDSQFEDGCPTQFQMFHKMSDPGCTSTKSSGSNPDQTDSAAGRIADLREQVSFQQAETFPHNENKECCFRGNKTGGEETGPDTVQTEDTESSTDLTSGSQSVCHGDYTETDLSSCSAQEELGEVCQMENNKAERDLVLNEPLDSQDKSEAELNSSTDNEDVDLVFETSVDGSEVDNADADVFFQQLYDEGRVYWAEPVQILSPTLELKESGVFEVSGGSCENSPDSSKDKASDVFSAKDTEQKWSNPALTADASSSSEALVVTLPATPDLKLSSRSVSVQMSSSPSSHIVHRKDVPYVDDSKRSSPPPSVFPVDTSDPLRAVQAWTDAQIQRNIQKLAHRAPLIGPKASNLTQSSTLTFSSSPSFPVMSYDTPATNDRTVSASVDTGLWSDKEEEVDGGGYKDERNLWEGKESASMTCCCSCDHQRGHTLLHTHGDTPLSLGDLEEMMLCLQHFRSVHRNMEEQLCEDQASVYSALSDHDREMIQDLEVLRGAVKQETAELEAHLNELAHHYDDSLKMKMHRLLDEQSLLFSHLSLPGAGGATSGHAHSRTVQSLDVQRGHALSWSRWNMDTPRQSPSGSESSSKGPGPFH